MWHLRQLSCPQAQGEEHFGKLRATDFVTPRHRADDYQRACRQDKGQRAEHNRGGSPTHRTGQNLGRGLKIKSGELRVEIWSQIYKFSFWNMNISFSSDNIMLFIVFYENLFTNRISAIDIAKALSVCTYSEICLAWN